MEVMIVDCSDFLCFDIGCLLHIHPRAQIQANKQTNKPMKKKHAKILNLCSTYQKAKYTECKG